MEKSLSNFIKSGRVFVFSGTYCPYCTVAKESLTRLGVKFDSLEIDINPLSKSEMNKLNQLCGFKTIPKIFIGTSCIGGNSDLQSYIKTEEIYQMLEAEGVTYNKL